MTKRKLLWFLWSLAVLVPLLAVWAAGPLFWSLTNRAFVISQMTGIMIIQTVIASFPFLALATFGHWRYKKQVSRTRDPELVAASVTGLVISALIWGVYYYDGYTYWRDGGTGGANIGLALLMLASPLFVGLAMAIAYSIAKKFARPNQG